MKRRSAVLGGVTAAFALLIGFACSSSSDAPAVAPTTEIVLLDAGNWRNTPTGTIFAVMLQAQVPGDGGAKDPPMGIPGITLTLAAQPASLTVSPASAATDPSGDVVSYVLVPYNAQGVLVVSAPGNSVYEKTLPNPPVTLTVYGPTLLPINSADAATNGQAVTGSDGALSGATGSAFSVTAVATAYDAAVPGLPISFALVGAAAAGATTGGAGNSSGAGASSGGGGTTSTSTSLVTDSNGYATADLLVPYDSENLVVVTAGGAVVVAPRTLSNGAVTLVVNVSDAGVADAGPVNGPAGTTWGFSALASANDAAVEGLPVTFTLVGAAGATSTSVATTNAQGGATADFLVPYGAAVGLIATGGGALASTSLVNGAVQLAPLSVSVLDAGIGPTSALYAVAVSATANAMPAPGLPLTFQVAASSGAFGTVATATTDGGGAASADIAIPYGTTAPVEVTGGGSSLAINVSGGTDPIVLLPEIPDGSLLDDAGLMQYAFTVIASLGPDAAAPHIAGVPITFSVLSPIATLSPLVPPSTVTNSQGQATTYLVLRPDAGTFVVAATGAGMTQPFAPASN